MSILDEDTQPVSLEMAKSILKAMETPIAEIGGSPSVIVVNREVALDFLASSLDRIIEMCLQQKATS